jgi:ribose transport system substrate-binding protein
MCSGAARAIERGVMKRVLCFLCISVVLLAGCRQGVNAKYRIAVVVKALDSEFWLALKEGAQTEARLYQDLDVVVLAPEREINIDQQVSIIEDQIHKKVSCLVVAPCGTAEVIPVLTRARERGIPSLIVDTDVDWPDKLSYIGTDNRLGGKMAGDYIARALGGKGKVAVIRGIPGVRTHEDRLAGFQEALAENPGLRLVALQPANSERALAMTVMENILTSNPDLGAVFATSDQMALGAIEAVDAHRLSGKLVVVGFDAGKEALRAVSMGRIAAMVAQNPFNMGKLAVAAAYRAARGESVEKRIDTGTGLVTKDNAAEHLK